MIIIVRACAAALSLAALAACVGNPDSTLTPGAPQTSQSSEPAAQPEYYGRTEFEIAGGDGQVVDYQ